MISYIIRRLMILPIIMFLVTLIIFFLIMQLPIQQRMQIYVPPTSASVLLDPEKMARLVENTIEKYGLDKPFPVQYINWLRNLAKGQWGYSPTWNQSVLKGLLQRAPATAELALAAMIPSVILALALGGLAARHHNHRLDYIVRAAAFVSWAFPSFILALLLVNVFYARLDWFPPLRLSTWASSLVHSDEFRTYTDMYTVDALLNGNLRILWDAVWHLVLPGVTLAATQWALLTRIMRSSMLEVLSQDYITTARAKGVHERRVINLHARRNALLPVISTGGVAVSLLLTWVVVIETVFSLNGIGRAAAEAIVFADIPVAVGFAVFSCTVTVLASLSADILYAFVDPRVRL
jgi:ABC-type dipeptide/oligopeptide/nickel transport system permease component